MKKKWDELSLEEQAEMMRVAVKNGIYDLYKIRDKYNEFAEGGEVANEIPMDYQPLISTNYQPVIDSLKASNAGFNVDDYTYRVQKLHPEITRDQVQSLYNATPYIASDKVIGTREGGFRPGDETGYGRRVTLYPNAYTQNTGTKVTPSNSNETLGDTLAHETNHLYTDILLGGSNDTEKDLLFDAYRPGFVVQDHKFDGGYQEERAINAQIRNRISRENGNVTGAELDKAIDNTPDDVLMEMLFDPNNGYINQSGRKHMQDKNGNWNRTDVVRKALKDVALNSYENLMNPNAAALGGPIVEMAREYAKGGGIHIKPSHRGRLTALKKRTGKTEAELYRTGSPAVRKMITFARSARKWKHGLGGNLYEPGGWLSNAWDWLKNAAQVGAIAESPAVMTAAGHRVDRGKAVQDKQSNIEVKQLRENLTNFGEGTLGAITATGDIEAVYNAVRHPVQTAKVIKQGTQAFYKGVKKKAQNAASTSSMLHDSSVNQSLENFFDFVNKRVNLNETQEAAELGRQDLLKEIGRESYKEKWKKAYPKLTDEMVEEIVKHQQEMVEDMPINFSRSSEELREHPDYDIWGITEPRPEITKELPDGRTLHNTNTGQDVSIANDRGTAAMGTAYHEGQHYMTGMAKGRNWFAERMNVKPEIRGIFEPITFEDKNVVFNPRGELWQHAIMDQNNNLLPPVDRLYNMAVNSPYKLKKELTAIGKTPEEAERIVSEWADEAQDMLDIQEQRAHLKTFFKDKVKPLLKNEDDASEIEAVLVQHPELIENTSKVKLLMEKLRPGSLKDYAKYFTESLSVIPLLNTIDNGKEKE